MTANLQSLRCDKDKHRKPGLSALTLRETRQIVSFGDWKLIDSRTSLLRDFRGNPPVNDLKNLAPSKEWCVGWLMIVPMQ
jgi:hypothetical protein